ncbi:hypothetical protein GCM10009808_19410 [Microbacterium sediminicola]|uniref:HTH marR-type domain-containing protein n=1 Tax=Microbacterium sediminicola TaxID=415210 RepID=A0ABP4UDV9_9MICO
MNDATRRFGRYHDDDVATEPLDEIIDPDNFTPRLLALLSNALVWRESQELLTRFDLGTNDWRVLSALAVRPGSSATEITDFIGVNKAVVSKSVNRLAGRHLIVLIDGPRGSRPMFLTRDGARMHDDMLPVSIHGQEIIVDGMTDEEIHQFNEHLRRMLWRLRAAQILEGEEPPPAASPAP